MNNCVPYSEVASQAPFFFPCFVRVLWDCKRLLASHAMTIWQKYHRAAYHPSPKICLPLIPTSSAPDGESHLEPPENNKPGEEDLVLLDLVFDFNSSR